MGTIAIFRAGKTPNDPGKIQESDNPVEGHQGGVVKPINQEWHFPWFSPEKTNNKQGDRLVQRFINSGGRAFRLGSDLNDL